jgi:hypothetical protein
MKKAILPISLLLVGSVAVDAAQIPHLVEVGDSAQLVVDDKPVLLRAGETDNSCGEPSYLSDAWKGFDELNMNAVVTPVYWDVVEPAEGKFDWTSVDGIIDAARAHKMHVVFLWFGSWKNSMSCYAPAWVKKDSARFPRAVSSSGRPIEMLSAFDANCLKADSVAFSALMKHIREYDAEKSTVVMMQVENEIGMVETPRDHSRAADAAFAGQVPAELLAYLKAHRDTLSPTLRARWVANGEKTVGTWAEVFGKGDATDEIFMAWSYAAYAGRVAKAGKAEYALPMYANAALIRPGYEPGQYPSAGPLPHLVDIWRAAAPSLDFISPDIYFTNFTQWSDAYQIPGNAHFIPETLRSPAASVNALYAFGENGSMGYSPYGINFISGKGREYLAASYDLIRQIEPLLLEYSPKGQVRACVPLGPEQRNPKRIELGGVTMYFTFQTVVPPALADGVVVQGEAANAGQTVPAGAIVISTAPDEFVIAGTGVTVLFTAPNEPGVSIGLLDVEEGRYDATGKWRHLRWLNGDQTNQGRQVMLDAGRFGIQRVRLYRY